MKTTLISMTFAIFASFHIAQAEDVLSAKSSDRAAASVSTDDPSPEKSFFESRSLEDIEQMLKVDVGQSNEPANDASSSIGG